MGGTGVIVRDLGLLWRLREAGSGLARVLSLLAVCANMQSARAFARLGVSRIVLPRFMDAAAAGRPQLLTAVDQEGGPVVRLGHGCQMTGNMALGAIGDPAAAEQAGRLIGEELSAVGLNYDAAPVVDVNVNPQNPVIGLRSFSDDPALVAQLGTALMAGIRSTGVISTLKHFPGHGDTATDSHIGLPRIEKGLDELKRFELIPFQACIDAGAEAIMTAHIQYPLIEKQTMVSVETGEEISLPATLSKTILTDLLRGERDHQRRHEYGRHRQAF